MTIREALNKIDTQKPNSYSQDEKIEWLSRLDGIIKEEIIDTHEGAEEVFFGGYNGETDLDTVLLVPEPYDEVYLRFLETQIDYTNNEYGRYNNSLSMYKAAYSSFRNFYNRKHLPKMKGFDFF